MAVNVIREDGGTTPVGGPVFGSTVSASQLLQLTGEVDIGTVPTPAAGFILFVDSADHKLKAKGSAGTVTTLGNP
jgi:hypothetical protein